MSYVCGINSVINLLKSDKKVFKIYHSKNNMEIIKLAKERRLKLEFVNKDYLTDLVKTDKHQGIVAQTEEYKYYSIEEIIDAKPNGTKGLIVILDQIEDPHNFGAIIRTCDAAGVDGIVIAKNRQVQVNPTVSKVSTGADNYVKIARVSNIRNAIETLKKMNYWVISADMGGVPYTKQDFDMNCALVIGSEGKGISSSILKASDFITSIPMHGQVSSLNASVSAAILIYKIKEFI